MVDGDSIKDIEGTPEYQALLVAVAGKPERSMGDSVIPAEPPNWSDVRQLASDLMQDPPHLGVLVQWVKAEANLKSFNGMTKGLALLTEKLLEFWEQTQPLADEDDPDDQFYERINLLHELSDDPVFVDCVYRMALVNVRGIGSFSARDIDISRGQVAATDEETSRCQEGLIRGALQEAGKEQLIELDTLLKTIPEQCKTLENLFLERAGQDNLLSLGNLSNRISENRSRLLEMSSGLLDSPEETDEEEGVGAAQGSATIAKGAIKNREDVCLAFDRVIEYYQKHEPSSPLPVFAARARDMVPKPFFAVLYELAPAYSDDFSGLVSAILGNPLSYLMQDCYRRFMDGSLDVEPLNLPAEEAIAEEPYAQEEPYVEEEQYEKEPYIEEESQAGSTPDNDEVEVDGSDPDNNENGFEDHVEEVSDEV